MEGKDTYLVFLEFWQSYIWYVVMATGAASIVVYLAYKIEYLTAKHYKDKYEIASKYEIKRYLQAHYAIALAVFFAINGAKPETVALSEIWFFIRIFIGLCGATLYGYIAFLVFRYYYPSPLDRKLKKLRYAPRVNPKTGNKMTLLSEEEEDAYLDEGMQAEENAFSVDYDVWLDSKTGETHIEKYAGHLAALQCDRCGFQTLKLQKEEIIQEATVFENGEILKEYKCSYCGRIKRKTQKLTRKSDHEIIQDKIRTGKGREIEMIKIEIHSIDGANKIYEFQNLHQAQHFLEEFDLHKVNEDLH